MIYIVSQYDVRTKRKYSSKGQVLLKNCTWIHLVLCSIWQIWGDATGCVRSSSSGIHHVEQSVEKCHWAPPAKVLILILPTPPDLSSHPSTSSGMPHGTQRVWYKYTSPLRVEYDPSFGLYSSISMVTEGSWLSPAARRKNQHLSTSMFDV